MLHDVYINSPVYILYYEAVDKSMK